MFLLELFLPTADNRGVPFKQQLFDEVRTQLTERFGGVTIHARAPAHGISNEVSGGTSHDDMVIYEVMTEQLDRSWWSEYRRTMERAFRQESVLIRATEVERL